MSAEVFLNGKVQLCCGDSLHFLRDQPDNRYDSIVTDPPYALVSIVKRFGGKNAAAVKVPEGGSGAYSRASAGFMGKSWDTGETAFAVEFWAECLRVLKPGGHVVAFSGTRTYHRMVVAIEDAGFEVRDMLQWLYGSGFPKSHDVSKGIDKAAGVTGTFGEAKSAAHQGWIDRGAMRGGEGHEGYQRPWMQVPQTVDNAARKYIPATAAAIEWQGWGTALKPANEPIVLARKPLSEGTVAANVLRWGTGAINIDACRVPSSEADQAYMLERVVGFNNTKSIGGNGILNGGETMDRAAFDPTKGRWPANVITDGSEEVVAEFPGQAGAFAPIKGTEPSTLAKGDVAYGFRKRVSAAHHGDSGSAARFFYTAKADADDRIGSKHPTIKPVDLMQWLVRLVTPKGGLVLDPFAGTGTTAEACYREGMRCMLVEREIEYHADIRRRMALCMAGPEERSRESIKAKTKDLPIDHGPLFSTIA